MNPEEEYFTPPVRDDTLHEIMEGEAWVPPSAPHTPTLPLSTAEYYNHDWSTMDYSCCSKDRKPAGVQTDATLVELPPSSSEGSSSDPVSAPSENSSLIPIPLPVVARSNRLQTVLDLSMSRQCAVRSKGHIDKDFNNCRYIHGGFFNGLDRYYWGQTPIYPGG